LNNKIHGKNLSSTSVNLRVLRSNPLKFQPLSNVLTRLIFEPVQRSEQEGVRGCTTLARIVLSVSDQ
jgi:hypothetical protein